LHCFEYINVFVVGFLLPHTVYSGCKSTPSCNDCRPKHYG